MRSAILAILLLFLSLQVSVANSYLATDSLCSKTDTSDEIARQRTFDYFFVQALSLREQERYDEAFDLLEHCLWLQPSSSAVSYELYSMYSYLGRKSEALEMMKRAAEGDPKNFWYRSMLAMAYEDEGLADEAIKVYEAMTNDFSSNSNLFMALASAYSDKADYEKAIWAFDQIERIEGKNEQITLQKYRYYMLMHNKEKALAELQGLIDEYPDDNATKVFLGNTYLEFGDTVRAFEIYSDVQQSDANNVLLQKSLADYYQRMNNDSLFSEAVESLLSNERYTGEERAGLLVKFVGYKEYRGESDYNIDLMRRLLKVHPDKSATAEVLARYMQMRELSEDSIAPVLEEILYYEPENNYAQVQLLLQAVKKTEYDEVITRCDAALLYSPEILELYYFKGIAQYNKNMHKEALETLTKGLSKRTDNDAAEFVSDIFSITGDLYHELGDSKASALAYDSALVYNENNLGVLNNYAYYIALENNSELEKALEMSHRTVKAEPENKTYIDTYMWILFLLERYDEAKAYAEKLLSLGDEDEQVLLVHCGDIFAKCGDIDRAVELWKKARENGNTSKLLEKKIKRRKYIPDGKKKK